MEFFLAFLIFWIGVLIGGRRLVTELRRRRFLTPARSLKEIKSAVYYSRLTATQFESLVMQVISAREYSLLGNPWLGRTKYQGYAWKRGKQMVLTHHLRGALTKDDLDEIEQRLRAAHAAQVLVFSPLSTSSKGASKRVEVLAGKSLLRWFAALDTVAPPPIGSLPAARCDCGAAMQERVNRAGLPLQVCSMYPGCKVMLRPAKGAAGSAGRRAHNLA